MPIDPTVIAKSKRPVQPDETLKFLVGPNGSVYYEVVMMDEALKRWTKLRPIATRSREQAIAANLALEGFLLHFRNLRDFFYPSSEIWTRPKWYDNAVAWDFCRAWTRCSLEWSESSPGERDRINKLLSHISYGRSTLDKDWSGAEKMAKRVMEQFDLLLPLLTAQQREWFRDLLSSPPTK